jgi:hypothetical protein
MAFLFLVSTGAKLVDAIIEGVLSQDKAFFEGIVVLLLKKITQYWLKRPKKIVTTNFDPVLKFQDVRQNLSNNVSRFIRPKISE